MKSIVFASVIVLGASLSASAQTVVNPTGYQFTASADHNTVLSDGSPKLDHYETRWFAAGATMPFQSDNIGKPTPDANGIIAFSNIGATFLAIGLGVDFTIRIASVGSGGEEVSLASNPFEIANAPSVPTNVTVFR